MTRLEALKYAEARLREAGVLTPEAEAQQILRAITQEDAVLFWLHRNEPLPQAAVHRLEAVLRERAARKPLQLILGTAEFFGLVLEVAPGVLIPRPETEGLVEIALELLQDQPAPRVLDVGTGSGAIALALKHARPDAAVWATDTNPAAVALARRNAARLGLAVEVVKGAFTAGLTGFHLIVSNPPYLPEAYRHEAPPELAWEPPSALYAGPEGLDVLRPLARAAHAALEAGGWLALELSPTHAHTLAEELEALGFSEVAVRPDLAGRARYLTARIG